MIKQMMEQFLFQSILQLIGGAITGTFKYFLTVSSFLLFKKKIEKYFWNVIFI